MTDLEPQVTTALACKIVRLDRPRLAEALNAGFLSCIPKTTAGRARLFGAADLLALWLFRDLIEDGYSREKAARMACDVAEAARRHPDATAITFVEDYFYPRGGTAYPADVVPSPSEWDKKLLDGTNIRKATIFNVGYTRLLIAERTAEAIRNGGDISEE